MSGSSVPIPVCPLRSAVLRAPDAVALVDSRGRLTYGELDAWVDAMAQALAARGVCAGDVVAMHLPNGRLTVALLLAVIRLGAAACPLNLRNPLELVRQQLARAGAAVLIGKEDWHVAGVRCFTDAEFDEQDDGGSRDARPPLRQGLEGERPASRRPATIVFTSGSTAEPKAAAHSLDNHLANAAASNRHHGLAATDRWLLALPLYHVGGLAIVFRCLLAGAAVAIPDTGEDLAGAIARFAPTHLSLVPTQLARLLAEQDNADPKVDRGLRTRSARPPKQSARRRNAARRSASTSLSRVACMLLGGAPAPDALVAEALARGLPVRKTYGLTETASQVTAVPPGASAAQSLTAGLALECCELQLAPDGEILVRGASLFLGYRAAGRIVRPVDGEGWFATGDLGSLDTDGFLAIVGRKDNLFVSGGENIQPEEVEAALSALPEVACAVVVPVPDAEFGQRPVAFVRSHSTRPIDALGLTRALAACLPRYKIPVAFHPLPADEETRGLKTQRQTLMRLAATLRAGREAAT